jgi:hypothetical protein
LGCTTGRATETGGAARDGEIDPDVGGGMDDGSWRQGILSLEAGADGGGWGAGAVETLLWHGRAAGMSNRGCGCVRKEVGITWFFILAINEPSCSN